MPDLIPDPRPDRVAVAQVIAEAAYEERVDRCVRRRDILLARASNLDTPTAYGPWFARVI